MKEEYKNRNYLSEWYVLYQTIIVPKYKLIHVMSVSFSQKKVGIKDSKLCRNYQLESIEL